MFFNLFLAVAMAVTGAEYAQEIETWRTQREARLRADDGWLTVSGLFWLQEGTNTIGASEANRVVLPAPAPERAGVIEFNNGKATLKVSSGVSLKVNGKEAATAELRSDVATKGEPDIVTLGDLTFFVIERGQRFGLRLKDKNSEIRRNFKGLAWYPVKAEWRIEADWVAYNPAKKVLITNVNGDKTEEAAPGYAAFTFNGKQYQLQPVLEDERLFFVFRDKTAGKTTYAASRFFYADAPKNGKIVLDFNKAYNPPCAFTPYSTCPLPVAQNRLPFEIPAGELMYKGSKP